VAVAGSRGNAHGDEEDSLDPERYAEKVDRSAA
jgi:hypothetical protein